MGRPDPSLTLMIAYVRIYMWTGRPEGPVDMKTGLAEAQAPWVAMPAGMSAADVPVMLGTDRSGVANRRRLSGPGLRTSGAIAGLRWLSVEERLLKVSRRPNAPFRMKGRFRRIPKQQGLKLLYN